jgi:hypothetical protein
MRCVICYEIEQALRSTRFPVDDASAPGLSIMAKRNRYAQRLEQASMLEGKLARHKKLCKVSQATDQVVV